MKTAAPRFFPWVWDEGTQHVTSGPSVGPDYDLSFTQHMGMDRNLQDGAPSDVNVGL